MAHPGTDGRTLAPGSALFKPVRSAATTRQLMLGVLLVLLGVATWLLGVAPVGAGFVAVGATLAGLSLYAQRVRRERSSER